MPFFNTTHGAVIAALDSFATCTEQGPTKAQTNGAGLDSAQPDRYSDIRIRAEIVVPISHNLLAYPGSSESLSRIKKVYSHEQALGQCSTFLSQHLPDAEQIVVNSTSRAAELISASRDTGEAGHMAAISSAMAAEVYKVPIAQHNIQDRDDNTTRFFVIENTSELSPTIPEPQDKSLILFSVSHAQPGALFKALETLFRHQLNMTGIHQRPPNQHREEDVIFVEVGGSVGQDVISDLKKVTVMAKNLGSW